MTTADILDDLFPACALAAFLEQAAIEQGWPDSEATRRRAYQIYEEALAVKNGRAAGPGNHRQNPATCDTAPQGGPCAEMDDSGRLLRYDRPMLKPQLHSLSDGPEGGDPA
jgi:hypothetical protein